MNLFCFRDWCLIPIFCFYSAEIIAAVSSEQLITPLEDVLEIHDCPLPSSPVADYLVSRAKCGWYEVWENRSAKSGRKIKLHVMFIPATKAISKPDPIFMLAGGPGEAATKAYPPLLARLRALIKERDIVLVDQRGTGLSNPLDCNRAYTALQGLNNLSAKEAAKIQTEQMRLCLADYDAAPEFYGTNNAMDDLNDLREAMGYPQINLMGISYGSRAALVYLRRHGTSVRRMVIDGVLPTTRSLPNFMERDAQRSLSLNIQHCEENRDCHSQFPELRSHLESLINKLRKEPLQLTLSNAVTGEDEETTLYADSLVGILHMVLYSRDVSTLIPYTIEQAYQGNFKPLSALGALIDPAEMGMSAGMRFSVLCGEDFSSKSVVENEEYKFFTHSMSENMADACEFWPSIPVAPEYFFAVSSDVPVLLTSGELDPITPPVWGEEAAKTLSNAKHIVVPNVGHGTWTYGCMPEVLADFIAGTNVDALEVDCVAKIKRPAFFYNPSGPVIHVTESGERDHD